MKAFSLFSSSNLSLLVATGCSDVERVHVRTSVVEVGVPEQTLNENVSDDGASSSLREGARDGDTDAPVQEDAVIDDARRPRFRA